jgi:hypothetical protein
LHFLSDRLGAADRTGWAIETGEEAVACGVHLDAAVTDQLSANERVMLLQKLAPTAIAKLGDLLG